MAWAFDERFEVATDAGHVAVHRGGTAGRPVTLLTHGTGFCASTWIGVAELLADEFELYAIDRRGHGASSAPDDAYDFTDFAGDAIAVIDALDLHDGYAIGHSAGATDLLLAGAERPHAFRRLFVIEPTAMDPSAPRLLLDEPPDTEAILDGFLRRRATFASRDEVVAKYTDRGVFTGWRADVLEAFARDGFSDTPDGSVMLCCAPEHEVAMLRPIFEVMYGSYGSTAGANPFDALRRIDLPTLVVTTEHSQAVYEQMADAVLRLVPGASHVHLDGAGHAIAQVDPDRVAEAVLRFWRA